MAARNGEVVEAVEHAASEVLLQRALALPGVNKNVALPAYYQNAIKAIVECDRLDMLHEFKDKSEQIAVLAKQLRDGDMVEMARRLRARTVRRLGEVCTEEKDKDKRREAAKQAGISEGQQRAAERIAGILQQTFDQVVDQPGSCSQSDLLKIARDQERAQTEGNGHRLAITALKRTAVKNLQASREFFGKHEPETIAKLFGADRDSVVHAALQYRDWLNAFLKALR